MPQIKSSQSVTIIASQFELFVDAIFAAAKDDVGLTRVGGRKVGSGAVAGGRDSNVMRHLDAFRDLRTRPVNSMALFDNVVPVVHEHFARSGFLLPKPVVQNVQQHQFPAKPQQNYRQHVLLV